MIPQAESKPLSAENFGRDQGRDWAIDDVEYVEMYVGNAFQAAYFYQAAFGFTAVAYAGLETGVSDRISILLEQREIRLMVTSPLDPEGDVAKHVRRHGDSVKDIAFSVDDAETAYQSSVVLGAKPVLEPEMIKFSDSHYCKAVIGACGPMVHSLIQKTSPGKLRLQGYESIERESSATPIGVDSIDHIAIGVSQGTLNQWVAFYREVLGFHQSHEENVLTEYSGMNSKVVQNDSTKIKFPIIEPAPGKRKSQIEEFLHFHGGPGVQHIALHSRDILQTVTRLRARDIEFLHPSPFYYDVIAERIGRPYPASLKELNILIDGDDWGGLMQIFTKPVQSRPTLFWEIIQRDGARGFGGGNIRALFESVEREQALRRTLT